MPRCVFLLARSIPRLGCVCRARCEGARSCTTTIRNAHNTDERDIIYAWHPWVGRRLEILRIFERGGVSAVRCRLAGHAQCLPLEVPSWMFERSACASISSVAEPISDTASLCALSQLLAYVEPASTGGCDLGSLIPDSDADLMSCDQKQGDDHAPLLHEDGPTGVVRAAGRQRSALCTAMAEPAGPSEGPHNRSVGTATSGTREPEPRCGQYKQNSSSKRGEG